MNSEYLSSSITQQSPSRVPEKPALIVNIAIKIIPRMPETGQVGKCSRKTCWGQCYISSLCHQYPFGLVSCVFDLLDVVGSPTSSSDDVVFLFYNIFYFNCYYDVGSPTSSSDEGCWQGKHPAAGHLPRQEDGGRDDPKSSLGIYH